MQNINPVDPSSSLQPIVNIRRERRISVRITLYLRRPINSTQYRRAVQTLNISRNGACVRSDIRLEIGTELIVTLPGGSFSATAIVTHQREGQEGWITGVEFLTKKGRWLVT